MTAFLALASALIIGGSDFSGGLASRQDDSFRIAAVAQLVGGIVALVFAFVVGADEVRRVDVVASCVAGISGTFSFVCFYRALSIGVMSVIAPTTAVVGATMPAVVGFVRGDEVSGLTALGLAVAVAAIVLVARGGSSEDASATPRRALILAVIAGIGFSLLFLSFAETHEEAGMWPLVIARVVSVPIVCTLAWRVTGHVMPRVRTARRLAVITGVAEMIANALLLVALRRDEIAIASVFGSLYPVSTVLLAWYFLKERVSRAQLAGVGLAITALVLVAA